MFFSNPCILLSSLALCNILFLGCSGNDQILHDDSAPPPNANDLVANLQIIQNNESTLFDSPTLDAAGSSWIDPLVLQNFGVFSRKRTIKEDEQTDEHESKKNHVETLKKPLPPYADYDGQDDSRFMQHLLVKGAPVGYKHNSHSENYGADPDNPHYIKPPYAKPIIPGQGRRGHRAKPILPV